MLLLTLLAWMPAWVIANEDPHKVLVVISERSPIYSSFEAGIRAELGARDSKPAVSTYSVNELKKEPLPEADLVVAVGTDAALSVAAYDSHLPVLFTLLTEQSYRAAIEQFPQHFPDSRSRSALFIDHPVADQLQLIRTALPGYARIGLLLGPSSGYRAAELIPAAERVGLRVHARHIENEEQLYPELSSLLPEIDVVLALPDAMVYNQNTIRSILITTYRHRKPVVGYSKSFVKAGALLGMYSEPGQLSKQAGRIVAEAVSRPQIALPPLLSPSQFELEVNYWVAEALNIPVRDTAVLTKELQQALGAAQVETATSK